MKENMTSASTEHQGPTTTAPAAKFSLRWFAPGWGAAVMGTSVISTIFTALREAGVLPEATSALATVFLVLALGVGVIVLGLTTARWVRYPSAARADLAHPVKGGMSATFGGGFLTLAVALGRSGQSLFGEAATVALVAIFAAIGGALALIFGVAFLSRIFARGDTPAPAITGAWFIPPVVTIVIPTALAPLIHTGDLLARELLWVSWIALGMGGMLYLAITAVLIFRSATSPLPPAQLAPSLLIGMGPAGLIGLNLTLLTDASVRAGVASTDIVPVAEFAGLAVWGFGLWWAIAGLAVLKRGYQRLPFSVASWGFTFPLGAWTVAGIVLGSRLDSSLVLGLGVVGAIVLIVLWLVLAWRTFRGISSGSIWE